MENVISIGTKKPVVEVPDDDILVSEKTIESLKKEDIKKKLIEAANDVDFEHMLIIGQEEKTGLTHFYSLNANKPYMLWLLVTAGIQLFAQNKNLRG